MWSFSSSNFSSRLDPNWMHHLKRAKPHSHGCFLKGLLAFPKNPRDPTLQWRTEFEPVGRSTGVLGSSKNAATGLRGQDSWGWKFDPRKLSSPGMPAMILHGGSWGFISEISMTFGANFWRYPAGFKHTTS